MSHYTKKQYDQRNFHSNPPKFLHELLFFSQTRQVKTTAPVRIGARILVQRPV